MILKELAKYDPITIQCHDNPDADAIAAGYALCRYFESLGKHVRLVYGGRNKIQKPNLLLMLEHLEIPITHIEDAAAYIQEQPDGKLLYEEALADGVTAVCNERPFYAVASRETDELLFYQMGEEGVYVDPQQEGLDVEYLETMFFDEDDDDLYLVYKDGRVVIYFVEWSTTDDVYFCGVHGRYAQLPGKMKRYEAAEGTDYAFLCGDDGSCQISMQKGQMYSKLSGIRGFLAFDARSKTLYLHNGDEIYTSPLYDTEEVVDMGRKALQVSSYWNYTERWPGCLSDD